MLGVLVFLAVAIIVVVALYLGGVFNSKGNGSGKPEKMDADGAWRMPPAWQDWRHDPPSLPQPVRFEARPMQLVAEGRTKLPKQLYLALNYQRPEARRIPVSQEMVDVLHDFLDPSKDQPAIGQTGPFWLVRKPGPRVVEAFNTRLMATVSENHPDKMDRVVSVVETSQRNAARADGGAERALRPLAGGSYAVYAFFDLGVDWAGPQGDFCQANMPPCVSSDIYVSAGRAEQTRRLLAAHR